jgi:hypothetical protein
VPASKRMRSNSLDESEQNRILNDVSIFTNDTGSGSPRKGAASNLLDRPANIIRPVSVPATLIVLRYPVQ